MSTNAREKNENQARIYGPDDLECNAEHHFKGTTLSEAQQFAVKLCKRIKELGGELPMNWRDCELIYLERFVQKLQRNLDRQVIGLRPPQQMHTKRAYARMRTATLLAVKSILLTATYRA